MNKKTPAAIFLTATALLTINSLGPDIGKAGQKGNKLGGLKEWSTDQAIDADSKLDKNAKKAAKKAKEQDICIPIGEGENCW